MGEKGSNDLDWIQVTQVWVCWLVLVNTAEFRFHKRRGIYQLRDSNFVQKSLRSSLWWFMLQATGELSHDIEPHVRKHEAFSNMNEPYCLKCTMSTT